MTDDDYFLLFDAKQREGKTATQALEEVLLELYKRISEEDEEDETI